MKRILFPTDFSTTADNALHYAVAFAQKLNSTLVLFNTYPIPVYVTEIPTETVLNERVKSEAENLLKELEKKVHNLAPDVKTERLSSWGFAADEINFHIKENNIDLVIMGTHGASGLKKIIFGSNTADVISRSSCPVLAVPDGVAYKDFLHIAFATDCNESEIPSIKTAIDFAKIFNADFTLVHISDGILNTQMVKSTLENFCDRIRKECDFPKVEIKMVETPDIVKGLTESFLNDEIDLMVIAHKKRNILSQLVHPSISKKISYQLVSPLLALPLQ